MTARVRNALAEIWRALTGSPTAVEIRKEWEALLQKAEASRGRGDYAVASVLATKALELMERDLGPEHLSVGALLNDLGGLHTERGRHAEAELLHKRALAIREKVL